MKTYKVKNYKGNLVESLSKFQKKYPGMKICEATEEDKELKIKVNEDNKKLRMWDYWLDREDSIGGYESEKHYYNPHTGKGGIAAYSKDDAYNRIKQQIIKKGLSFGPGKNIQSIMVFDKSYPLPSKTKTIDLGDLGSVQVPMSISLNDVQNAVIDFINEKFPTK